LYLWKDIPLLPALLVVGLVLVTLWGSARWRDARRRWRIRARRRRALQGEQHAEALLEDMGYEILDRQVEQRWTLEVNQEPVPILVRADLLVRRGPRTWIAEVKTGQKAPLITNASTRRQLLEYRLAYRGTDGVLLVNAERGLVQEVRFPLETGAPPPGPALGRDLLLLLGGAALGAGALWWGLSVA
jgi:hypothetical protein